MKICILNGVSIGSTGQIAVDLCNALSHLGHSLLLVTGDKGPETLPCPHVRARNALETPFAKFGGRFLDNDGWTNAAGTKRALKRIASFSPDALILGNMHGMWIDTERVFRFAIKRHIPLYLLVHDNWWATGRCGYYLECPGIENKCQSCPNPLWYPRTLWKQKSGWHYGLKRELIGEARPTFLSNSRWALEALSSKGATDGCKSYVLGMPIDDGIFHPSVSAMEGFEQEKAVGFVCGNWTESKGLSFALKLAELLIKKGKKVLFVGNFPEGTVSPDGCAYFPATKDKTLLARYYASMSVLVNPTLSDAFSMINCEAIACGTPVVTFQTGGAFEMIEEGKNGFIVPQGDLEALETAVLKTLSLVWDPAVVSNTVARLTKDRYSAELESILTSR